MVAISQVFYETPISSKPVQASNRMPHVYCLFLHWKKKRSNRFFYCVKTKLFPFLFLLYNKTSQQCGHSMGLLFVPVKTEFAYVLHCPVCLCTIPQLSFPSLPLCFWICVQLREKLSKGTYSLTCTSSETKIFSQLLINRTDCILLVSLFLFCFVSLQVSFPNSTLAV